MSSDLLFALGLCLAGLVVLVIGAELLVRGGSALARRLKVPPILIGLTIVSLGTSAPELAIGIDASLKGNGPLAVGNVAGTNTVNLLLILGLSALMRPLKLETGTLKFDLPCMMVAALALLALSLDGVLTWTDGLILLTVAIGYSGLLFRAALRQRAEASRQAGETNESEEKPGVATGIVRHAAMLLGGILIIVFGADWLVNGGIKVAEIWGVSDAFIGLTVIAIGTSAPELVTTVVSTLRGKRDIAIGNLLGSSTYNIAFILGVTCLFPAQGISVPEELLMIDIPVMIGAALLCFPAFLVGKKMSRLEGGLFVAAYAVYLGYLLIART